MVEAEGETADLPGPSSGEEEQDPPAGRGHGQPGPEDGPPHTENHPDLLLLLHRPPHRTQTQHRDAVRQDRGDGPLDNKFPQKLQLVFPYILPVHLSRPGAEIHHGGG